MERLAVETVLAPVDGSDESAESAAYAVAVADRYDASLHALHILGESLGRAMDAGAIAQDEIAEDHRTFLEEVRADGEAAGVPVTVSVAHAYSTTRKTQHPGSVILDCAVDVDADFLVIPRESTGDWAVLEKAAEYVLLYASQPVLSV